MSVEQIRGALLKTLDDDSNYTDMVDRLRNHIIALRAQSVSKEKLLEQLEYMRAQKRIEDDEPREDAIMDVMDMLLGFISPHSKIE